MPGGATLLHGRRRGAAQVSTGNQHHCCGRAGSCEGPSTLQLMAVIRNPGHALVTGSLHRCHAGRHVSCLAYSCEANQTFGLLFYWKAHLRLCCGPNTHTKPSPNRCVSGAAGGAAALACPPTPFWVGGLAWGGVWAGLGCSRVGRGPRSLSRRLGSPAATCARQQHRCRPLLAGGGGGMLVRRPSA